MNDPRMKAAYRVILLFVVMIGIDLPGQAQAIDTAFLYRISNAALQGKSLALRYDGTTNRPVLDPSKDYPTQYWRIQKDKYGNYRLSNFRQGKDFSIELINDAEKDKLTLGATRDVASQAWKINRNANGTYRITCLWIGPEKSLGFADASTDHVELMLKTAATVPDQSWQLTKLPMRAVEVKPAVVSAVAPAASLEMNVPYRLSTQWQGEGMSLGVEADVPNHPRLTATGENRSQYWKLMPGENGHYRLINLDHPDWSLDVINDGKNDKMILNPSGNYAGQYWKFTPDATGTYHRLTSLWQGEGKSLDIVNDGKNTELILNPTGNYSGQYWKLIRQTMPLPPPVVATEAPKPALKSKLLAGEELLPGMKLVSPNGEYTFIQQKDGNLVLYHGEHPLWASDRNGKDVQRCVMQSDGNLVQYLHYNVASWASGTNGHKGAYLSVQDDGNVVIYSSDNKALWATNTQER